MLKGYHIGRTIPRSWLPEEASRTGDPGPADAPPSAGAPVVASAASLVPDATADTLAGGVFSRAVCRSGYQPAFVSPRGGSGGRPRRGRSAGFGVCAGCLARSSSTWLI